MLCCRIREQESDLRRSIECGVQRCALHRTPDVAALLRCLKQQCASSLPKRLELEEAGVKEGIAEDGKKTWSNCLAACDGVVGSLRQKCLRQSCGTDESMLDPSPCSLICQISSPDNVEECVQRYCPVSDEQEDQGVKTLIMDQEQRTAQNFGLPEELHLSRMNAENVAA